MEILSRIKDLTKGVDKGVPGDWRNPNPVATEGQIEDSEVRLGFEIEHNLRQLYMEIGNGGFGPDYGILGINGGYRDDLGENAVESYLCRRESDPDDQHWFWPEGLLPICHVGCAMYVCIDCVQSPGEIVWFEPNPHEQHGTWTDSYFLIYDSLDDWLSGYLAGEDMFEYAEPYDFGLNDDG